MSTVKISSVNRLKIYVLFWAFLIMVFSAVIYIQIKKQINLSADINAISAQLKDATAKRQALQQQIASNKNDRSIEEYVQNEFGMVHPYQVIIIDDSKK